MSVRSIGLPERVIEYLHGETLREPDILARLRSETAALGDPAEMQISPEQGQFMRLLVELVGARRILEVGTFTGYSSLACALALPPDGRLTACDISPEWTAVARRYWEEAGVGDRIELRLGPGIETLDALLGEGRADAYDMAFVDADKTNYDGYYERALRLVRRGGLILVDNTLWGGRVADPGDDRETTRAIRALNAKIARDERVTSSLVPIGDGLTLARRR